MVIEKEISKKKYILMVLYILEKFKIEKDTEKEPMYIKTTINMLVIGKMMFSKELEFTYLTIQTIIMEI